MHMVFSCLKQPKGLEPWCQKWKHLLQEKMVSEGQIKTGPARKVFLSLWKVSTVTLGQFLALAPLSVGKNTRNWVALRLVGMHGTGVEIHAQATFGYVASRKSHFRNLKGAFPQLCIRGYKPWGAGDWYKHSDNSIQSHEKMPKFHLNRPLWTCIVNP